MITNNKSHNILKPINSNCLKHFSIFMWYNLRQLNNWSPDDFRADSVNCLLIYSLLCFFFIVITDAGIEDVYYISGRLNRFLLVSYLEMIIYSIKALSLYVEWHWCKIMDFHTLSIDEKIDWGSKGMRLNNINNLAPGYKLLLKMRHVVAKNTRFYTMNKTQSD